MSVPFDGSWMLTRAAPMPTVASLFFMSIPMTLSVLAAVMYYNDYIESRTRQLVDPGRVEEFEFVVVGAGSAGSVVANRLSKHYRVLVLEAAGDPHPLSYVPALAFEIQRRDATDWQFRTEPQNNCALAFEEQRVLWPRGKGLGGSSNLNFMIYQRGHPKDFEQLANATGDSEWRYEELLPFFKKSENYHGAYGNNEYHGQGGPLHVDKLSDYYMTNEFLTAAKELGYPERDLNTVQKPGFSRIDVTQNQGARWSTYEAFIRPILSRPNLVIYRYARAIKIHVGIDKRVYGVTYARHGVIKFVRVSREVVVSAGSIDSPKLLMLSGIGPCEHLHSVGLPCRVNLPVGNNLQDHVVSNFGPFTMTSPIVRSFLLERDFDINTINDYLDYRQGYLSSLTTSAGVGLIPSSLSPDPTWPDLGIYHNSLGVASSQAEGYTRIMGAKPDVLKTYYDPQVGRNANSVWVMLGKPKSRGVLRLATRSPWDQPIIQPNYYSHPDDMPRMVEAVRFVVALFENTTVYRKLGTQLADNPFPGCEHVPHKSDAYYECYLRHMTHTIYHPVGTCSMGKATNDSLAVVDSQLRVLKVHGLRVADASVLRHITNSNLNAPSIMIGERAAFVILRYWAQQQETCPPSEYYFSQNSNSKCFYHSSPEVTP